MAKKWTLMVYMAGDNNLDRAAIKDISEMAKVGSSNKVNVLVQLDRAGRDLLTRRFYITKGGGYKKDCIETLPETNTGDPQVLHNFLTWAIGNYPANHYLLILWNHGGGWWEEGGRQHKLPNGQVVQTRSPFKKLEAAPDPSFPADSPCEAGARNICYDDTSGDALDNREMKQVFLSISNKLGRKIDIVGCDACLMNMVEVAYQVKDSVSFMVGSEETEPEDGWPYDAILGYLVKHPNCKPKTLARRIVSEYYKSYKGHGQEITQSALNLENITFLVKAIDALSNIPINHSVSHTVSKARLNTPKFFYGDYIDLYRFFTLLKRYSIYPGIKLSCDEILKTRKQVVLSHKRIGRRLAQSYGVSIYFPGYHINPLYHSALDFTKDCRWGELLKEYHGQVA